MAEGGNLMRGKGKAPSFQFYPADWQNDTDLQVCSLAARGLWMEMISIMHQAVPYGHLVTAQGRAIEGGSEGGLEGGLARLVRGDQLEVQTALAELEVNAVFSRTSKGIIYSRRMVRDEEVREKRRQGGKKGGEHGYKGAAHGAKGGRPRGDNKPPLKRPPSSSSSSSSSPSPSGNKKDSKPETRHPTSTLALEACETLKRAILEYSPDDPVGKLDLEQWNTVAREQWGQDLDRLARCRKVSWPDINKAARLVPNSYWRQHVFCGRDFVDKFQKLTADLREKGHWTGAARDKSAGVNEGLTGDELAAKYNVRDG